MKRISRDQPKFNLMRMLDQYARAKGVSIQDQAHHEDFLANLERDFKANRSSENLIHGLRIESMFAYIAAALGKCAAIKEEDAGDVYAVDPALRVIPDFRIVTTDQRELLIEVKNHRPSDLTADYTLQTEYLDSLRRYAAVFQRELYVAIYWSHWKLWSLIPADRFDHAGDTYHVSLPEAMKRNEMSLLGDCMLGTVPPLTLKFLSDPSKPRRVGADGKTEFTIANVELLAAGQVIEDSLEKEIAWFLLNHSDWPAEQTSAEIVEDELISFGFEAQPEPENRTPDQGFETIGFMSQMLSRQYNELTAADGRVDLLIPKRNPDSLGVMIPWGFTGEKLRLWRFYQQQ